MHSWRPVLRVLALGSLATACSGAAADREGRPAPPPPLVEVAPVRSGALRVQRTYLGQVRALARAELAAGAAGEVREVGVREGDRVEVGAALLVLDESLARAQLSAAQAASVATGSELAQARRDAERLERAGERVVPGVEIERAEARAQTLTSTRRNQAAQAARARAELSRHRVVAPFAGVVTRRLVDPGDWVTPGTPVLELVADGGVEVHVRVEPELLDDVAAGHPVVLRAGERSVDADVGAVVPALDPATRTAQLRVIPRETPSWLRAGGAVDVVVAVEHGGDDGVVAPRDALVVGAADTRVVKIVDGQAQPVLVEVLDRGIDEVRVRGEGLAAGDVVVVRGNERLRPDQPVRVQPDEGSSSEGSAPGTSAP
jgi:RND family efflux transporter MFP subunit